MTEAKAADFGGAIVWLSDPERADPRLVGGKCASLAAMAQEGMRVPGAFAVTTEAFAEFVRVSGLAGDVKTARQTLDRDDPRSVSEFATLMADRLERLPMPAGLDCAIRDAYDELSRLCGETDVPVAVRSSGVAEDLDGASYAGQYETYLWITGPDAVVAHVKRCWAGLFGAPVLTYEANVDEADGGAAMPAMAVAVQRMVDARTAGVMLTLDPVTGDRSKVVIEASWGLGESVVAGEVTPDRFRIDKITRTVDLREIAVKTVQYSHNGGGGVMLGEVPAERQSLPCLEPDELEELGELARTIERRRGRPMDIEWAIDQKGMLHVLQARPETVWSLRQTASVAPGAGSALDLVLQQMIGGGA